jgi:HSP20 family molecular chaperone IbpA
MPNQGAIMLWQTLRSAAIKQSAALVQSFRRLKARNQHFDAERIEASFEQSALTVTLPKKPAAPKREKEIGVKAAA